MMETVSSRQELGITEKAVDSFKRIGITFLPIAFRDVYRITSRDTNNGRYPYNAHFSESGKERLDYALVKDGIEIGFYSIKIGKNPENHMVGETGMVHISPELRRKGLGTLTQLLSYIQLLEKGATQIDTKEGDETGTIRKNLLTLGFTETGKDIDGQPEWKLNFKDEQDRIEYLQKLKALFDERMSNLCKKDLSFDPSNVDLDNPKNTPIKKTLMKRLEKLGYFSNEDEKTIYGYFGADFIVSQLALADSSNVFLTRFRSSIFEKHKQRFITFWKKTFGEEDIDLDSSGNEKFLEIISPKLYTSNDVKEYAERLSDFGQSFFDY